jgi:hypothetical protein
MASSPTKYQGHLVCSKVFLKEVNRIAQPVVVHDPIVGDHIVKDDSGTKKMDLRYLR